MIIIIILIMTSSSSTDEKIAGFYVITDKPYGAFSNYYVRAIVVNNISYPSTEHYFQSRKFEDAEYSEAIRNAKTPNQARELAKLKIAGGYPWRTALNPTILAAQKRGVTRREDWDQVKEQEMLIALRAKFTQHQDLRQLLLSTNTMPIQELSFRDPYWGTGSDGKGQNLLGVLLMQVRDELKE